MKKNDQEAQLFRQVQEFLEDRRFKEALDLLTTNIKENTTGEHYALCGKVHFLMEDYEASVTNYQTALQIDPKNAEWQEMLGQAKSNVYAAIHEFVPDIYFFEREPLLTVPTLSKGALPKPLPPIPPSGRWYRLRLWIGNVSAVVLTRIMDTLTLWWGQLAGYRDRIWTNWYRRPVFLGLLTLAYMRERLNKYSLISAYPAGSLVAFQSDDPIPPEGVTHYRTADGSWNNLTNPMEGAARTRFHRNVARSAAVAESPETLMTPNPRELSRIFLTRHDEVKEVPFLNMLAVAWIQFQNHDWVSHGEPLINEVYEIPLAEDDPARKRYWQTKILVGKTQPDPTRMEREDVPLTFVNEVTHWWDGSQLYGSDQETLDWLRSGTGGKLRLSKDGTLPRDKKGIEETGYVRNWWVGLAMMHTLFAREHNAICDHLQEHYPEWDDNRLFHTARLINAALMAKIHSVEWNSAINPNKALDMGNNSNWYGILTNLFRKGKHRKTVADINVRNPEMGGVVGNPIEKHGSVYGLTQEFVEVYRLHSMLPEVLKLQTLDGSENIDLPFDQSRQAGSGKTTDLLGMTNLFFSFGNQHPGHLVLNNYPRFMQELSIPGNPLYDLGAVDILRARERGVPRYNEFRRQLGLNPIRSFEDLTPDAEVVQKLKDAYGAHPQDVEKLDLMIGNLAEAHRPKDFAFGETMFQIFLLNATRRLQADRFYTDCYTMEYYTAEGLEWIDRNDLKSVLLRHYPELANTGLANIKNAFEPWDTDPVLDPLRHPLRAYDKELKKDPWRGDAG